MTATKQVTIVTDTGDVETTATERMLPWQKANLMYTASGYGAKIPTAWVVRWGGRERRIYCTIYSNIGTCWVIVNGKKVIVH